MDDAIAAAISSENSLSRREIGQDRRLPRSTFDHRLRGRQDRAFAHAWRQLLLREEEKALTDAVERLCKWNWAPPTAQIKSMAEEILAARGVDPAPCPGKNWVDGFLGRHSELRTILTNALRGSRAAASSFELILRFLDRLERLRAKHGFRRSDIWNFDEKGV